jgi:Tfp pilus assembly protein FimT
MPTRGSSLPELTVVVALVAISAALGVPSLRYAMDRRTVENATQALIQAHTEARLVAIESQRTALLTLAADSMVLRTARDGDTLVVWRRAGPSAYGVTVTGTSHIFRFIPYGYSIGASNTTYILTRGAAVRKVIIARYGRVRVQ